MGTKISELSAITTLALNDIFPVVDVSANITHKITLANLINQVLGQGANSIPWASVNKSGSKISDIDQVPSVQRSSMEVNSVWEPLSFHSEIEQVLPVEDPDGDVINDWVDATEYELGDYVKPAVDDDQVYECIIAGTSGGGEPAFNNTIGVNTVDNTVTWCARGLNVIETQIDLRDKLTEGMPLLYNALGTAGRYYGRILSISDTRIFITGAPFYTTKNPNFIYYSIQPLMQQIRFNIPGTYGDGTDDDLLGNDLGEFFHWLNTMGRPMEVYIRHKTNDSTSNPMVNIKIRGTTILLNDDDNGLKVSTSWQRNGGNHPVAINFSANYFIVGNDNHSIRVTCTVAGDTGDAADLSVMILIMTPPHLETLPVLPIT